MTIILHSFQIAFESRLLFKRDCFGYNKAKAQINCMQMSQGWENRIQAESASDLLGDSNTVSSTTLSDVFHNSCKLYATCGVWQCLNAKQFNISQNIEHSPIFSSHKKILYSCRCYWFLQSFHIWKFQIETEKPICYMRLVWRNIFLEECKYLFEFL